MEKSNHKIVMLLSGLVLCSFLTKIFLSMFLPITGDEAYFCVWAGFPDFGYYDHPPMAGWILSVMFFFGKSILLVRLPAILSTLIIGICMYLMLKKEDNEKAFLVAVLFLVSPFNLFTIPMTTDTPLIVFCFLSAVCLFIAMKGDGLQFYMFSGVLLGLAFLSKYFAVLLAFAYLVFFVFAPKTKKRAFGYLWLFACAVPFVVVNLYWNYTHCWVNLLFNLFNRNKSDLFSLSKVMVFLLSQAFLITPPLLYYLIRKRREVVPFMATSRWSFFAYIFIIPMCLFAVMSCKKMVGLHWVLAFYPFLYLSVGMMMSREELFRGIRSMIWFSLVLLVPVSALLVLRPVSWFAGSHDYNAIVMGLYPDEVIDHIKPYEQEFCFATPSYVDSAVLSYHSGNYFSVFGGGSLHGREDDIITDYRDLNEKNILIFSKKRPDMINYRPYFAHVEESLFKVHDVELFLVAGYGFKFEEYRAQVLVKIRDKHYAIPSWLPCSAGGGYFFEKYFPR